MTQVDPDESELKRWHAWHVVRTARSNPLLLFFFLAYAIAWVGFLPLVLSRAGLGIIAINVPIQYIVVPTFAPSIAALLSQRMTQGNFQFIQFFTSWRRAVLGMIVGPALIVIAFVIVPGLLMTKNPASLHWSIFGAGGLVNWSTFLGGPIGEEPGWRGYALPRLQAWRGPFIGSLILAVLWAVWHLPLFWVNEWRSVPFWMFLLIITAATFLMTFGANISRFSIMAAVLMHATFNTSSKFLSGLVASAPMRETPSPDLIFSWSPLALALILVACTRGRLGSKRVNQSDRL